MHRVLVLARGFRFCGFFVLLLLLLKDSTECCVLLCITQKDFEDQRGDLGNDNDHGNDDIIPPKGLPKGRGVDGSSKMFLGNALLLLDRK